MTEDDMNELDRYLEEFDDDYALGEEQRKLASEDMRFSIVKGGHWEGFMEETYGDRTRLELDMVNDSVERFMGDFADNRIEVSYTPNDDATSEDDGVFLQKLYRADSRKGRGKQTMMAAVGEAVRCGFGAVKLSTSYENDEDPEDDRQHIVFEYIPNAYNCVAFDSNAKLADKSDAERVTVLYEYEERAFRKEYPDADFVPVDAVERRVFDWNHSDSIFIGYRYEIEKRKVKVYTFISAETEEVQHVEHDDLDLVENDLVSRGWERTKEKTITKRELFKVVFSGSQILEERRKISGKTIPIIPVYAYRYYVDSKEYYSGLVRGLRDAQRLYNMEVSQAAEVSSSGNRDIPLVDPKSFLGYEAHWLDGNIYDKQFLPAAGFIDDRGNSIPALQGVIPAAQMSPTSAALLEIVGNYIKQSTGGQIADITDVDMSGKAIRELVKRINLNTRSIWINIEAYVSRMGEVYKSIASDIYHMPRSVRLLNEDGTEESSQLMKMFLDESGRVSEKNNIKKMNFQCHASVGSAYESQRAETVETTRSLITEASESQAAQEYLPVLYATLFDNLQGAGLEPLKEFNRKKQLQLGLVEPKDQKEAEYLQSLNQPNPQDELVKAAAAQQMAEAEDLKAHAIERHSKAELNRASAVAALENMKTARIKALRESISSRA